MEKLAYVAWRRHGETPVQWRERLLAEVGPALRRLGAARVQISVADLGEHEIGLPEFGRLRPVPDALLSFWLSSAYRRAPAESLLMAATSRLAGYLVSEGTILPNRAHPAVPGERAWGFSQVAMLYPKRGMSREAWRRHWVDVHTQVAIETQANFRYVQNVVVEPLTADAPAWLGIVEESFPMAALRDQRAFFDAVGDEAKFARNTARMMASVGAFLDADGCDLMRTSAYPLDEEQVPPL